MCPIIYLSPLILGILHFMLLPKISLKKRFMLWLSSKWSLTDKYPLRSNCLEIIGELGDINTEYQHVFIAISSTVSQSKS